MIMFFFSADIFQINLITISTDCVPVYIMANENNSSDVELNRIIRQRKSTNGLHNSPSEVKFHSMAETLDKERKEREKIVLWKKPVLTIQYFGCELLVLASSLASR